VQPAGSLDQEAVWQNPTHIPTSPFFERTSKRRKGFPSETQVKRACALYTARRSFSKSWAAMIRARAAHRADLGTAVCAADAFDGLDRHYFFPRIAALRMRLRRGDCANPRLSRAPADSRVCWAAANICAVLTSLPAFRP
jgi:hypothetical protein